MCAFVRVLVVFGSLTQFQLRQWSEIVYVTEQELPKVTADGCFFFSD